MSQRRGSDLRYYGRALVFYGLTPPVLMLPSTHDYDPRLGFVANLHRVYFKFDYVDYSYADLLFWCFSVAAVGVYLLILARREE